jgi:hypothetical protein
MPLRCGVGAVQIAPKKPLLWVSDAAAWAVGASGDWQSRVSPVVENVHEQGPFKRGTRPLVVRRRTGSTSGATAPGTPFVDGRPGGGGPEPAVADPQRARERGDALPEQDRYPSRTLQPRAGPRGVGESRCKVAFGERFVVDDVVRAPRGVQRGEHALRYTWSDPSKLLTDRQ